MFVEGLLKKRSSLAMHRPTDAEAADVHCNPIHRTADRNSRESWAMNTCTVINRLMPGRAIST
ncbi:hypothetical protein [Roseateles aquatilis]|uniref:hypothetical protein n=1 Tax=Roseateles aquatilis TaxID=431061 RepID=UPI001131B10A|nr:hypothetical protein [Roseateles aquatilis]